MSTVAGTSSLSKTNSMKRTLTISKAPTNSSGTGSRISHFWNVMLEGNASGGGAASNDMSRPINCVDLGRRSFASSSHILQYDIPVRYLQSQQFGVIHPPCTRADICYFEVCGLGGDPRMDKISKILHPMIMHQIEAFAQQRIDQHAYPSQEQRGIETSTNRLLSRRSRVKT